MLDECVATKKYEVVYKVIKAFGHDKDFLTELINLMTTNDDANKAADYLNAAKLDPLEFPHLRKRLQKKYVRYLIREYPWFKAEEMIIDQPILLGQLVQDLFHKSQLKQAISITMRHDLLALNMIDIIDTRNALMEQIDGADVIQNPLYSNDQFVPTDEIAYPEKKGEFLNLEQIGFLEENIIIIDKKGAQYDKAVKAILSASLTGIDCEFRSSGTTKLDSKANELVSIVQIAVDKTVYIFDGVSFEQDKEFGEFLTEYLESLKISKIGHSLSGDIDHMRKTFPIPAKEILSLVDIKQVYLDQNPSEKKCSLAHIAQSVYGKPLSKMDQCSSWTRKPFRRAQVHYAAMDAAVCLGIYYALMKKNK